MLTIPDDYLTHQLPVPIAQTSGERNFYDRYWFNGYSPDGSRFFLAGLAVYPQLGIADASFSFADGNTQYNLRSSRHLQGDRHDSRVGPIEVEVIEPLKKLRLKIADAERGFEADLVFTGRFAPVEEPRHSRRVGSRILLDSTRMTQMGHWSGHIAVKGQHWQLEEDTLGTRDRSWGVRPVGRPDSQPLADAPPPQFYWLWAPVHFADSTAIFYRNDDDKGLHWNRGGHLQSTTGSQALEDVRFSTVYAEGSRRVQECTVTARTADGTEVRMGIAAERHLYMSSIGYMHPEWGHGFDQGSLATTDDEYDLSTPDPQLPPWLHIQAFSRVRLSVGDEPAIEGCGVLEQLLLGPHAPSGFTGLLDPVA